MASESWEDDIEKRVYEIEKKLATGEISTNHSNEKITALKEDITKLQNGINRVLWALAAAVLLAIANFIIQGGLSHVG